MKYRIMILAAAAALCLAGCAKTASTNYGELSQRQFDAWIALNKQASWQETELGSWIIELDDDATRTAAGTVDDYPYALISYTVTDLEGTVSSTTYKSVAQKLGSYQKYYYYGPRMTYRGTDNVYAGVEEILNTLHEGGHFKAVIPGWLLSASRYSTKQKYLDAMTATTSAVIYDVTIEELVPDAYEWELNILKEKMGGEFAKADSLGEGLYYICDVPTDDSTEFTSGAGVYLNYICRRVADGQGVDTNLADSAKVFGTYSASSTYSATLINWAASADELTMGSSSSSIIDGYSIAIFQMYPHEKGRAYMVSNQAYGTSGSGSAIPAFCPLVFELEMVDE